MTATPSDYTLPTAWTPPDRPRLSKIALEEHFDHVGTMTPKGSRVDVQGLVKTMGYDSNWFDIVSERLTEFDDKRLAEMDAPAARWIERAPISENDRRKIAYGNARGLFTIGV